MPPPDLDDDSLHTLLSRGRLSGAQRDRIFEHVAREHAASRRVPWAVVAILPVAAAIALAAGVWWKQDGDPSLRLVPKGTGTGALAGARCPDREAGRCRIGDRLIFEVDGAAQGGFFAGYAECAAGERIWYFPTKDGALPAVAAAEGHAVLGQAARIGQEHGVGRCLLHLFVLEAPLGRAELASGKVPSSAIVPLEIVR